MLLLRLMLFIALLDMTFPLMAQETRQQLAFTHVTVIDCTGNPAQSNMTVLITGDRIELIGKTDEVTIPAGARVIDSSGKFMIPGLWDMHIHNSSDAAGLFLVNGVLGTRVMWGNPAHLHDRERAGELGNEYDGTTNRTFFGDSLPGIELQGSPDLPFLRSTVASPLIDGPGSSWPGSTRIDTEDRARQIVRVYKKQGYDFLKVYSKLSRDVYFAIVEEAQQEGMRFAGHVPFAVTAAEASDAGQATIEHLTEIYAACSSKEAQLREQWGKAKSLNVREARATYDSQKAETLFARFAKNRTWQVPTLTVLRWMPYADSEKLTQDERLRFTPAFMARNWRARAERVASSRIDFSELRRRFAQDLMVVGQMHEAGVGILAGTDTANPFCLPGFGLHDELELLVLAGLSPMEALQAATKGPAEYLERLNDLGTVERGKMADIVLLNANPLDDINNVRQISSVVFAGHYYSRKQLDDILAERELEHSIIELAESFSPEKLQALTDNKLINRVRRLRLEEGWRGRMQIRMSPKVGTESGKDASLLFQHMPNLEDLYLNNTDFNDAALSRLSALNKLTTLELGSTQLTDQGLVAIEKLTKLQSLSLADTRISDGGLPRLTGLTQLRQLDLSGTKVTHTGLTLLRANTQLEELKLDRTQVSDESLLVLTKFNGLKRLQLAGTPISDEGLTYLAALQNLATLELVDTDITDKGLEDLQQIKSLTNLDLTNTMVTPEGVKRFKLASPDCIVVVSTIPQLTVKLASLDQNAFFESGKPIVLTPKIRAVGGAVVDRVEFLVDGSVISTDADFPYEFIWEGAKKGHHLVAVRVNSGKNNQTESQTSSIFVGVHGLETRVTSSADDVEEAEDGSMYTGRPNLHFARDGEHGFQVIGLRFDKITIPQGAKITRAYAQFTAAGAGKAKTRLAIRAQRSTSALMFSENKSDVSSRLTTESSVNWSPPQWMQKSEQSDKQRTSDLSRIIQEVVSQDDWKSGNALALVISGRGYRNAVSYDGDPNAAPILHVEFAP